MAQEHKGNNCRLLLIKALLLLLPLAVLFIALRYFGVQDLLRVALDWVAGLGAWGMAAFVLLYVLATVLFLPGSILTLGAGALFGVVKGSIIVSLAATLGATAAFLVGRYLARGWVTKRISGNTRFQAVDQAVAREGWKIVGLTRLSPVFPFNLLNYAFGLTSVSLRDYFWATWIGMIPGGVMYVYLGSLAGDLALLGVEERSRSSFEWGLYLLGLVATVAVTIYVTRLARAALAKKV
ncbi:MAG: TVP38/TMEM64 family protein [Desulfuromonadaceae bacterium]|nr:TVP38/TMEM64 family protein [Desulfuromonadaceae bacterium]